MAPILSILSYAVNGRGLGHLSRQVAIHRWLRRYATFAGVRSQHWFLTTSEADTLLFHEGFASFKLPSKSAVAEAGIPKPSYLALAKQWVWHSLALLRPELFIVDTFPGGSFQELLGVLDLCRHPALVLRPVRPEFARRPSFRALAGLYERVVIPSEAAAEVELAAALGLDEDRLRFVGPIMRGESFERLPRAQARACLGVPEGARCLLVSGGGGGDDGVAALLDAVEAGLAELEATQQRGEIWLVYAAGPLFRGRPRGGPRRVWWTSPDLPPLLAAFDGAVCAGGFNAVHELAHAGVPTILVPQRKVADDQHDRARVFVEGRAALRVELASPGAASRFAAALGELLEPDRQAALSAAARALVPRNNARAAARELLSLCLPAALVEQAQDELDEATLTQLAGLDGSLADLVQLAAELQDPRAPIDRSELGLSPALELLEVAAGLGVPLSLLTRIARIFPRRIKATTQTPEQLGDALEALLRAPACAGQWSGLAMVLDALPSDRERDAAAFATQLTRLLDVTASAGHGLLELTRVILERDPKLEGELLYEHICRTLRAPAPASEGSSEGSSERAGGQS